MKAPACANRQALEQVQSAELFRAALIDHYRDEVRVATLPFYVVVPERLLSERR